MSRSGGRKKDPIWQYFIEKSNSSDGKTGSRATCKKCKVELQGIVKRMKRHWEACQKTTAVQAVISDTDNNDSASTSTASTCSGLDLNVQQPTMSSSSTSHLNLLQDSQEDSNSQSLLSPRPVSEKWKGTSNSAAGSLSSFVIRTSKSDKEEIDKQIAKALYATNSSFTCIEQPQVKKAIALLRPGYVPPSRHDVSNRLLTEIYNEEKSTCFKSLSGSSVCLSLDGWSNVHNEPIICATVTTENGKSYLVDTIDTSGKPHTSVYLTDLAINLIKSLKTDQNCVVSSIVTDNAANMNAMRNKIQESIKMSVITYGCAAHILNLLCKDLEVRDIKEHVVFVVKYFRNNHFASATYAKEGGKKLVVPNDVRWNSLADCLEVFIESWPKLLKISEEHKNDIDAIVREFFLNIHLKRSAEDYLAILKPISVAIDRLQRTDATLSDVVQEFKNLESAFEETNFTLSQIQKFRHRYEQCITPYHLLAYLLDPTKPQHPSALTADEKSCALKVAKELLPSGLLPLIIQFLAKSDPFTDIMFDEEILKTSKALYWWKSQQNVEAVQKVLPTIKQLLSATASSASVERVFSTFGLVHSKLRNRLGTEKAAKLVFLYKYYN